MKTLFKLFHYVEKKKDLNKSNLIYKSLFFIVGILSLVWFIIRVIPKPQRACYPCMKATMPFASAFVIYLISLGGSVLFFRKALNSFRTNHFKAGIFILLAASVFTIWSLVQNNEQVSASSLKTKTFLDPIGANAPIGSAKGIFPGRVVWVYDADATNFNCTNANKANAYFQNTNTDQNIVDQMFSKGILNLTGQYTHVAAWDAIFKFFNANHGKGSVGYSNDETIFIKINAVSAWSGVGSSGEMPSDQKIEFDTSPQSLLALLRSLINEGGVPQANIYLGDPLADIWNHVYNILHAEFPNVKYVSQGNQTPGRYTLAESTTQGIYYSDNGETLTDPETIGTCYFYEEMMNADYLINVPSMKGHEMGGVTMFAKNFFGANTHDRSWELHAGLVYDDIVIHGMREEYKMYRVLVDLMACKYLGGNTLIYFMDGLWSTSWEHQAAQKFEKWPFNNDWSSSLFFSLDPVAIESVGIDIMQNEFDEEIIIDEHDGLAIDHYIYAQYGAVDDYLHQAASSEYWPTGVTYDPDNTGTPIASLGVHEHWNNSTDMQYSRNLGTGQGIELVKLFKGINDIENISLSSIMDFYPNPCIDEATLHLTLDKDSKITVEVFSAQGDKKISNQMDWSTAGEHEITLNLNDLSSGIYFCRIKTTAADKVEKLFTKKIIVN